MIIKNFYLPVWLKEWRLVLHIAKVVHLYYILAARWIMVVSVSSIGAFTNPAAAGESAITTAH